MSTPAQKELALITEKIAEYKASLQLLQEIYDKHPAHVEIQAERRRAARAQLILPPVLEEAWKSLVYIEMSFRHIPESRGYEHYENSYTQFRFLLEFDDGRSFSFSTSAPPSPMIHMDYSNYNEFGWAPGEIPRDIKYSSVEELWNKALHLRWNEGKHICCAIASLIYFAYCQHGKCGEAPWNLQDILKF